MHQVATEAEAPQAVDELVVNLTVGLPVLENFDYPRIFFRGLYFFIFTNLRINTLLVNKNSAIGSNAEEHL